MNWETAPRVQPSGSRNARIALIGEAPGAEEEKLGIPFVGGAGTILDGLLSDAGIRRRDCYIDNVVPVRPPGNNFKLVPKDFLAKCQQEVRDRVKAIAPNVVVLLGNHPLEAFTGSKGIMSWRGSILRTLNGLKAIPTIHPAALMRDWSSRPLVLFDLERVREESASPEISLPNPVLKINPNFEEIRAALHEMQSADHLAFDIETYNGVPSCIGFSPRPGYAICIPFCRGSKSLWTLSEEAQILRWIQSLLAHPHPKKIAQNIMFDASVLYTTLGIHIENFWMDTMVCHHCVYPELPKGLDTLCSIYTRHPYYKNIKDWGGSEALWRYNCLDATVTLECALAIHKEALELGVWGHYKRCVEPAIWPLATMQVKGTRIDVEMRSAAAAQTEREVKELEESFRTAAGKDVSLGSPKQLAEFLYDDLGFPKQYSRITNNVTVDADAIEALQARDPHSKVLQVILDYREKSRLLSTYLRSPLDDDKRSRCSYNVAGTTTGRISSSRSLAGTGGNLQNVPKGIARMVYVPDPGKIFVGADLSQAEARVVAALSHDPTYLRVFAEGGDIHTKMALVMFKDAAKRQLAKKVVHASNYGMGPQTFARNTKCSLAEAKAHLERFHATFPLVREWHARVRDQLRLDRTLSTPFGHRRLFMGRWDDSLFREAYAFVPQHTVGIALNIGLANLYYANLPDVDILLQIHDAIVFQCWLKDQEYVTQCANRAMVFPIDVEGETVTIPSSVKVGKNWHEVS